MNESRLKRIMQVLPFYFGMNYADWLALYSIRTLRWMATDDPNKWEAGRIASVNSLAREEMAWIDGLLSMSYNDFEDALATIKQRLESGESITPQSAVR